MNVDEFNGIVMLGLWILWPCICVSIARGKNRHEGTASLFGILFGPFAVIGYLLIKRPK